MGTKRVGFARIRSLINENTNQLQFRREAQAVLLTDADTTLTVEDNCGRINIVPDLGGTRTYTLPSPVAGRVIEFVCFGTGGAADNKNFEIKTSAATEFLQGAVTQISTDSNAAADWGNGTSDVKVTIKNTATCNIKLIGKSDTVWYILGNVTSVDAPVFA